MTHKMKAVYRHGVLEPQEAIQLPEGLEVELTIDAPRVEAPLVADPAERARILREAVEGMRSNPFPTGTPRWSRDELHERR